MGRGLSELQRTILRLALRNRDGSGKEDPGIHVVHPEVLSEFYGFTVNPTKLPSWLRYTPVSPRSRCRMFSPREIGDPRYNAAHVAVSRAFRRLADRGLLALMQYVHGQGGGGNLTEAGETVAKQLSANSPASCPAFNH
jgi:hypothetical protein